MSKQADQIAVTPEVVEGLVPEGSYYEPIDFRLFFSERIWPCHAGGYWWRVEALEILPGPAYGFNEVAMGQAAFRWLASRKIKRHKRELAQAAASTLTKGGGDG